MVARINDFRRAGDQEDPPSPPAQISVDTTVQHKVVAFPVNARLCVKGLHTLVREAKRAGLTLRQGDTRVAVPSLSAAWALCECQADETCVGGCRRI